MRDCTHLRVSNNDKIPVDLKENVHCEKSRENGFNCNTSIICFHLLGCTLWNTLATENRRLINFTSCKASIATKNTTTKVSKSGAQQSFTLPKRSLSKQNTYLFTIFALQTEKRTLQTFHHLICSPYRKQTKKPRTTKETTRKIKNLASLTSGWQLLS